MNKSILLLSLLLVPALLHADLGNPVSRIFNRKSEEAGPCPAAKYKVPDLSYDQMKKEAFELKLKERYCEAIAYNRRMMAASTTPEQMEYAWFDLIESSFYQRDYDELFRQATKFILRNPVAPRSERVYYLAVRSVYENIELTGGNESRWIQAGLGVSSEQIVSVGDKEENETPKEEPKELLPPTFSFKVFLEKYPHSNYAADVKNMLNSTRQLMAAKFIPEARHLAMTYDYVPAMNRLKIILNQGPSVDCFSEALFEMINITYAFAYRVTDDKKIFSNKLARWLLIEESEVTPELRKKLSRDLEIQAHTMKQMMREKLPDDKWTKRLM